MKVGSWKCVCNNGLTPVGALCQDIDECSEDSHNCDDILSFCNNTIGSFACTCHPAYQETNSSCVDADECNLHIDNCSKDATCLNTGEQLPRQRSFTHIST